MAAKLLSRLSEGVGEAGPRALVIAAVSGVFLAFLGPFGTAEAPIGARLVYWLLLAVLGTGVGITTSITVSTLLDPDDRRPLLMAGVTSVAMSVPGAFLVWAITRAFFALGPSGGPVGFFPPVLAISAAMSFVNALANRNPPHTHAVSSGDMNTPARPRFEARLPPKLRGADIHAVEAEDHYLRVHTSRGSDLILMRLSDAVAELEGVEGAQTHRSWWVARAAVEGVRRAEGRAVLTLPGGVEAPVSRSYARALRAEGWF